MLTRNCPQCHNVIHYSDKYKATYQEKKGTLCKPCSYLKKRVQELPQVGEVFGSWTVIDNTLIDDPNKAAKKITVQCRCGTITTLLPLCIINGKSKQCNNCKFDMISVNKYTGYKELSGTYYNILQNGAKQRGLDFEVSIEYLYDLFLKQDAKCALSNEVITLNPHYIREQRKSGISQTASVDRIDPSKGYVEGNVQWVSIRINFMKGCLSQEDFVCLCKLVGEKHNSNI